MKNKIKIFIYICLSLMCLLFFINYFISKTIKYHFYNELFTVVVLETIGSDKRNKFIISNSYGRLDLIQSNIKLKHIFSFQYTKETLDILFFSLKDAVCVKDRKYFDRSKNKKIQEYLKNECDK